MLWKNKENLGEIDDNNWTSMPIMEKSLNTMEKSMEEKRRKQKIDEHFAEVDENNEESMNVTETHGKHWWQPWRNG